MTCFRRGRIPSWPLLAAVLLFAVDAEPFRKYREMDRYDGFFRRYSERYFGREFDWRFFKAQAIAESRLEKKARSPDGALGIMQILPATFSEIRSKNPEFPDAPLEPRWNIAAAICYDRMLWENWHRERTQEERMKFMFGSYNAGIEAVLDAQQAAIREGLDPYAWKSIEQTLPQITGDASRETIDYVEDIFRIRRALPEGKADASEWK
jgi:membrane-bound lytic murein transglycosylase F